MHGHKRQEQVKCHTLARHTRRILISHEHDDKEETLRVTFGASWLQCIDVRTTTCRVRSRNGFLIYLAPIVASPSVHFLLIGQTYDVPFSCADGINPIRISLSQQRDALGIPSALIVA